MNALALINRKAQAEANLRVIGRRAIEHAQVLGVVTGLVGGSASGVFGSVFTAASWLATNEEARRWLATTGAILLLLTIPLLIIGGMCMDWLEKDASRNDPKVARYEDEDEEG